MRVWQQVVCLAALWPLCGGLAACAGEPADPGADPVWIERARLDRDRELHQVKHVIVVMQENHSFDSYFGALAYAPGSPYHAPSHYPGAGPGEHGGCRAEDHRCVDGLTCQVDAAGGLRCSNANPDDDGSAARSFHNRNRCVKPDLDHGWTAAHREANLQHPNATRRGAPMDGFVIVNDERLSPDDHGESPDDDETMGFYDQDDIPFYYDLAAHFAISDRFFASVLGPTFPNRSYLMSATSFGHVTTGDQVPPDGGYRPITGTIFDLLERNGVSWADYFQDVPQGASFRPFSLTEADPHFLPLPVFLQQVAGAPGAGELPSVAFVDPAFGFFDESSGNDEHPPTDIQRGQAFVSQVINAVRNGPRWHDTVLFLVYDEHGGFYDHVAPPPAHAPDAIQPGQCADRSNPPASLLPGGGAHCQATLPGEPGSSVAEASQLCPALAADPTGPFPAGCARFDQLGVRVPFVTVSPFARPGYVSHRVADHTSILAFIETVFLPHRPGEHQHLTARDGSAHDLLDLFDFARAPSRDTPVGSAAPPADDCTGR